MPYKTKESEKEYRAKWYLKNKEYVVAYKKKYREDNKDKIREQQAQIYLRNLPKYLYDNARRRAREKGLEFSISPNDIVVPELCPVLGIPIKVNGGHGRRGGGPNSPSLDRIDNTKGYTKDNILVVSCRANFIKRDATVAELRKVADFYENIYS